VEDGADIGNHHERDNETLTLTVIVSENPDPRTEPETTGPEHVREVIEWLRSSTGLSFIVAVPGRTALRNMYLQDAPQNFDHTGGEDITITFRELRTSRTSTVDITRAPTPRPDVGREEEADLGEGSTTDSGPGGLLLGARAFGVATFNAAASALGLTESE
jgi:hypothetical protein